MWTDWLNAMYGEKKEDGNLIMTFQWDADEVVYIWLSNKQSAKW